MIWRSKSTREPSHGNETHQGNPMTGQSRNGQMLWVKCRFICDFFVYHIATHPSTSPNQNAGSSKSIQGQPLLGFCTSTHGCGFGPFKFVATRIKQVGLGGRQSQTARCKACQCRLGRVFWIKLIIEDVPHASPIAGRGHANPNLEWKTGVHKLWNGGGRRRCNGSSSNISSRSHTGFGSLHGSICDGFGELGRIRDSAEQCFGSLLSHLNGRSLDCPDR
mmetsp:Transcript_16234/g.39664  ORF Transcript_16234/g.39664 Transcript_16234/m.39664 type:complete len:220 (-) Transcript_16234:249-908(-)